MRSIREAIEALVEKYDATEGANVGAFVVAEATGGKRQP